MRKKSYSIWDLNSGRLDSKSNGRLMSHLLPANKLNFEAFHPISFEFQLQLRICAARKFRAKVFFKAIAVFENAFSIHRSRLEFAFLIKEQNSPGNEDFKIISLF